MKLKRKIKMWLRCKFGWFRPVDVEHEISEKTQFVRLVGTALPYYDSIGDVLYIYEPRERA